MNADGKIFPNWESTFAKALLPLRWHQVDTSVLRPVAKWTRDGRWAPNGEALFNNRGERIA